MLTDTLTLKLVCSIRASYEFRIEMCWKLLLHFVAYTHLTLTGNSESTERHEPLLHTEPS